MEAPKPPVVTFKGSLLDLPRWIHRILTETSCVNSHGLTSTLDKEVDPIFDLSRWTGLDADLHAKMRPALQLASLWLTDGRVLDWFYHDTVGNFRWAIVKNLEWPYLAPNENLEAQPQHRDLLRRLWLAKLASLRSFIRFFHYAGHEKLPHDMMGCTFPFARDLERYKDNADVLSGPRLYRDKYGKWKCIDAAWPYSGEETTRPGILISDMFQDTLERADQVEYLNCCFALAVTLVHEIAHAAHSWPRFRYIEPECAFPGEAFSSRKEMMENVTAGYIEPPEPGYSWERSLFGGMKAPEPITILLPTDTVMKGMYTSPFRALKGTSGPYEINICSSEDIARWFQREYWSPSKKGEEIMAPIRTCIYLRLEKDSNMT